MPLKQYHAKRRFTTTPEPKGKVARGAPRWRYVIQKHAARRLHYDFRLELDGVLKSWAVPKGPSLDPGDKRLAVETEDHPLDYATFEGVIPAGQYGAGRVLLWDRGTWKPIGDPHAALRRGRLDFELHGEKLHGRFHLVRLADGGEDGRQWLLIKGRDEFADPSVDVVEAMPLSVASGVGIEAIDGAADASRPASDPGRKAKARGKAQLASRARKTARARLDPAGIPGATRAPLRVPEQVQLATLVRSPPEGEAWIHEMKLDGYRLLCVLDSGEVRWRSRNGKDWTGRLPSLGAKVRALPAESAILDGELVKLDARGVSDFQALQNALDAHDDLDFFAFDLLYLDGHDLARAPLVERKTALAALLASAPTEGHGLHYCEHVEGSGRVVLAQACELGLEGVVSKRRDRGYVPGRSPAWQKSKCTRRQEFVIVGFTDPEGSRTGIGALLLGVQASEGLVYAGKVGTGFSARSLQVLHERLAPLQQDEPPLAVRPRDVPRKGVHWVRPRLVCEVAFTAWTHDGRLRHPSFVGLREDKDPREVRCEEPAGGSAAKARDASGSRRAANATDEVAGVRLTHPDRVMYPEQGLTKRALAEFYRDVADWILPEVVGRPLALVRCPEGRGTQCFFQKHAWPGMPEAIRRRRIGRGEDAEEVLFIEDRDGLLSLVQVGVLEIHVWGARLDAVEHPDRMVFDLDPDPAASWGQVVEGARMVRDLLARVGLESHVRTTGGKGLHVVVGLAPRHGWDEVKQFAHAVSRTLAAAYPDRFTARLPKAQRKGKVFLDYLRNGRGATAIASYSTRARAGAPVATPIAWRELRESLAPDRYTVDNLRERLRRLRADPWQDLVGQRQRLPDAERIARG